MYACVYDYNDDVMSCVDENLRRNTRLRYPIIRE